MISAVMTIPAVIIVVTVVAVIVVIAVVSIIVVITVVIVIAIIVVIAVVALNAPIFALVMPPVGIPAAVVSDAENLPDDITAAIAVMVVTILRVSGDASGNDKSRAEGDSDRDALNGFCCIFHFLLLLVVIRPKRERRTFLTEPSGDAGESARCLFAFPNCGTPSGSACPPFIPPVYSPRAGVSAPPSAKQNFFFFRGNSPQ